MLESSYLYAQEGHTLGFLIFTGRTEVRGKAKRYFEAECRCGRVVWKYLGNLNKGSVSCGCARDNRLDTENAQAGLTYGKLTLTGRTDLRKGKTHVEALCECGGSSWPILSMLKRGDTTSCGCAKRTAGARSRTTHRREPLRLWRIYHAMKTRCNNPNAKSYRTYGAEGVKVCAEWATGFEPFRDWALANGYRDDLTIDRIDSSGSYSPDNCRWVPKSEQSKNRRPSSEWTKG